MGAPDIPLEYIMGISASQGKDDDETNQVQIYVRVFAEQLTLHIEVRGEEEGAAYQEVAIVDIGSRDQIVFIYTAPHLTT